MHACCLLIHFQMPYYLLALESKLQRLDKNTLKQERYCNQVMMAHYSLNTIIVKSLGVLLILEVTSGQ
jgi:hypothetical protein